ncbi:biotin--[acetyl-CoA-carboxylase] ligase [Brachybacterium sp. YJGR34]|uniref:biotin--[acetyl-CoA-carboxylase] ligase n=1 Tax=Brachybacterium sp. YJGR34 TaxID=2059911 RepID=UPI000E0C8203|nr:biotin--[acetyl-CoA-carboxylase] ligase [Brachybacterium sp. YJGR34]
MGDALHGTDGVENPGAAGRSGPRPPRPPAGPSPVIHRLDAVTSTQDEATRRLGVGEGTPFAVTARRQTAGRGRLGRPFASPAGSILALTHVHRSVLAPGDRGWIPLAAGLAALTALEEVLGADVAGAASDGPDRIGLKWPNDVHTAQGRKLGGILVEGRGAESVLVGIGLNLRAPMQDDGAPVPGAAWLWGEGGIAGEDPGVGSEQEALRAALEEALVEALTAEVAALESAGGDGSAAGTCQRYTMSCLTLGRAVRVDPVGSAGGAPAPSLHGTARTIDGRGRLVVDLEGGDQVAVDVGDVRHLRPDDPVRPTTDGAPGAEQEEQGT